VTPPNDPVAEERRSPESVRALLAAGAFVQGVRYPSSYDAVDALIAAARDVQERPTP
jgi:hypothetical protein